MSLASAISGRRQNVTHERRRTPKNAGNGRKEAPIFLSFTFSRGREDDKSLMGEPQKCSVRADLSALWGSAYIEVRERGCLVN